MSTKKEKPEKKPDKEAIKKNLNSEEYMDYIFNKIVSEWSNKQQQL